VNFPKGKIWQACLARALDVIPEETRSTQPDWNLTAWRTSGEPAVVSNVGNKTTFQASPYSFGSALLNEVQSLLDHAAEHRAFIQCNISLKSDCSPSWLFVTTYYWGLFSALAIIRLLGHAAWYMDKRELHELFAGSGISPSGAGTYLLEVGTLQGTTRRDFHFAKTPDRFHEASWKLLDSWFTQQINAVTKTTTSNDTNQIAEISLFNCVIQQVFQTPNWSSTLRNAVNYKPGFTYKSVHGEDTIELYSFFRKLQLFDFNTLTHEYYDLLSLIPNNSSPIDEVSTAAKLVSLKAVLLDELANSLIREVVIERELDQRWASKRTTFLKNHIPHDKNKLWPFA
jgi:hypothetical protein